MQPDGQDTRRYAYARFLLAWRLELADTPSAAPVGRGWVIRVPDEAERVRPERPHPHWFAALGDVPPLLQRLLDEDPPAAGQQRSGST